MVEAKTGNPFCVRKNGSVGFGRGYLSSGAIPDQRETGAIRGKVGYLYDNRVVLTNGKVTTPSYKDGGDTVWKN